MRTRRRHLAESLLLLLRVSPVLQGGQASIIRTVYSDSPSIYSVISLFLEILGSHDLHLESIKTTLHHGHHHHTQNHIIPLMDSLLKPYI